MSIWIALAIFGVCVVPAAVQAVKADLKRRESERLWRELRRMD